MNHDTAAAMANISHRETIEASLCLFFETDILQSDILVENVVFTPCPNGRDGIYDVSKIVDAPPEEARVLFTEALDFALEDLGRHLPASAQTLGALLDHTLVVMHQGLSSAMLIAGQALREAKETRRDPS